MSNKNKKLNLDKDSLYDLYINQNMTSKEIGEIFGCTSKSIRNYLKLFVRDGKIENLGKINAIDINDIG